MPCDSSCRNVTVLMPGPRTQAGGRCGDTGKSTVIPRARSAFSTAISVTVLEALATSARRDVRRRGQQRMREAARAGFTAPTMLPW
jgi:hypothetical protein